MEDADWHDGFDCTKQTKIRPEVKLLVCLKVASFGVSFSTFWDYFQIGERSVREALSKLAQGDFRSKEISQKFMWQMTKSIVQNVTNSHKKQHCVNGMVGCLDCMHIKWDNCPNSLHGQHTGKGGVPALVIL